MLCQNCGKNEVNFRYTQIINGVKKEMALCDKCAKSLGLESLDFNMPINFSNFWGDFFHGAVDTDFLPTFAKANTIQCEHCGMTYNEFIDNGKFGCNHCYNIFGEGLDNVLKNIHGSSKHVGRRSIETSTTKTPITNINKKTEKKSEKINITEQKDSTNDKLQQLNKQLKQAIQEERYEDAAQIRDEIKKLSP